MPEPQPPKDGRSNPPKRPNRPSLKLRIELEDPPVKEAPRTPSLATVPEVSPLPAKQKQGPLQKGLAYGGLATLVCVGLFFASRFVVAYVPKEKAHASEMDQEAQRIASDLTGAEKARDWPRAQKQAQGLLDLPPSRHNSHERAEKSLRYALAEQRNLLVYDRFMTAVHTGAADAAVLTYGELSEDSIYRELGAVHYLELRKKFVRDHLKRAQVATKGPALERGCRLALPHLDAIQAVDPGISVDKTFLNLQTHCRALAERQKGPQKPAPVPPGAEPTLDANAGEMGGQKRAALP